MADPVTPHRLIVTADAKRPGRFDAHLEAGGQFAINSRQPLVDGARAMLGLGFDPEALLTMRHAGKGYDSFEPRPISYWAQWRYEEGIGTSLQRRRWMPFPEGVYDAGSDSEGG